MERSTLKATHPLALANSASAMKLAALPIWSWDMMTVSDFLNTLGIQDKMLGNRWCYRQPSGVPPFELPGLWRAGPGAPRVIRKDKAIIWAESNGNHPATQTTWKLAGADLATLGFPNLQSPEEVQDVLSFLFMGKIITPAILPHDWKTLLSLYV